MRNKSTRSVSQVMITLGLAKYALRASLRNKMSYFFSLLFPLIFVLVFGAMGSGNQQIKLGVLPSANSADTLYQALNHLAGGNPAPIQLTLGDESTLRELLNRGSLAAIVTAPDNGQGTDLRLITSNANPQGAAAARSLLDGITSQLNLQAAGVTKPRFNYAITELSGKPYRYIDFALPGQIGFSLLSIATFGIAFPLITLRKTLVLKRMFATATTPLSFVVSQCLSRSVQALVQASVILVVGILAFHFTLAHGIWSALSMLVLSFIGILAFLGFGILIGNIARDEQSLPIALNLFNLPQILLAGVFFSTDSLPKGLQLVGNNLPLAYLNTAMRQVANEGASLFSVWKYIVGMLIWGVLAYIAAAKVFQTE